MSVLVSVVMPVYNEGRFIEKCIESLLQQDYPKANMEWIFVDGNSTDRTKELLAKYRRVYPDLIHIYDNLSKIVPCAMNIGIAHAQGKYIIRLDAHADYAPDYISQCVHYLETTDADNVGGLAETKASGYVGRAIAKMLSSRFGVGNSSFRTGGESGYVDTVPFGAFRREVFRKLGGYDERLVRNQDNEMNYRIRKNGGKVYLSRDIRLSYYCRDSIKGIARMAMTNGMWNVITMKLCPGSMGVRHFIPFAFVVSLLGLSILSSLSRFFMLLLGLELGLYLSLNFCFSCRLADSFREGMLLILLFPVFHISYGFGSFKGIGKLLTKQYRNNHYKPPII